MRERLGGDLAASPGKMGVAIKFDPSLIFQILDDQYPRFFPSRRFFCLNDLVSRSRDDCNRKAKIRLNGE
ncbi:hypothetical protein llap_4139 [Limosa lapponica baueri]|uniref:Uncharacterized protein n=1 Tax=Limosa lapponica baueri TaxID=1758121 RepID=A0A2I0UHN7_LIMLA|nr:hypothetical protein llap_4139 [Limosa lapponica baueri]